MFIGRTDVEAETPIFWPSDAKNWLTRKDWCWERLKVQGEGDVRGWNGWMASPTQWTWVWVNPGSWWGTGRPDVLQSLGSQRVGHDWASELNWQSMGGKELTRLSDFHFHFLCEFSAERFAHNLMAVPLYVICHFLLVAFNIFKFLSSW